MLYHSMSCKLQLVGKLTLRKEFSTEINELHQYRQVSRFSRTMAYHVSGDGHTLIN